MIRRTTLKGSKCQPLRASHHKRDLIGLSTNKIFALKAHDIVSHSDCGERTVIAVVAVDHLHTTLSNFYGQRRNIFTGNKRIAELIDMRLI